MTCHCEYEVCVCPVESEFIAVPREKYLAMKEGLSILRAWDAWLLLDGDQGDLRCELLPETSQRTARFFGTQIASDIDWPDPQPHDGSLAGGTGGESEGVRDDPPSAPESCSTSLPPGTPSDGEPER